MRDLLLLPKSPLRCPFCHEDCHPHGAVVCQVCLGRHHGGCWEEHGSCATCGSASRLVPETDLWHRSDEELFALLRQGRCDEVEAYVARCWATLEAARLRACDVATTLAFERLAVELQQRQRLQVVGPRPPERGAVARPAGAALAVGGLGLVLASAPGLPAALGLALVGAAAVLAHRFTEPPDGALPASSGERIAPRSGGADGASGSPGRTPARSAC